MVRGRAFVSLSHDDDDTHRRNIESYNQANALLFCNIVRCIWINSRRNENWNAYVILFLTSFDTIECSRNSRMQEYFFVFIRRISNDYYLYLPMGTRSNAIDCPSLIFSELKFIWGSRWSEDAKEMVVSKLEFNVNGLSVSYCRSVARINQSDAVFFIFSF